MLAFLWEGSVTKVPSPKFLQSVNCDASPGNVSSVLQGEVNQPMEAFLPILNQFLAKHLTPREYFLLTF